MCNVGKGDKDYSATCDVGVVGVNDDNNEESDVSTVVPIQYDPSISDGTDFI